jgi:hypothetical protein
MNPCSHTFRRQLTADPVAIARAQSVFLAPTPLLWQS